MKNKVCKRCNAKKPASEFYAEHRVADGLSATCRACKVAAAQTWNSANKVKHQESVRKSNKKYIARTLAASREWKERNPDKVRANAIAWAKENPAKVNAHNSRHRAEKNNATPKWANKFFIAEVYDLAQLRTRATGVKWEVDHIVPLRSAIVCGLHTEHNLRVILSIHNQQKGNRFWPDMP